MIAVIDMGVGNLKSVSKAVEYLGYKARLTTSKNVIKRAEAVILPGVGSFDRGIRGLKRKGLDRVLVDEINRGKNFLGICLGFQILFEKSEEGKSRGLGVLKGKVVRFTGKNIKIPHIGWNQIKIKNRKEGLKIFENITDKSYFYFVHSYYCVPKDKGIVLCNTDYGVSFVSGIVKDNIYAFQFHPEKSGELGFRVLNNFLKGVRN